MIWKWSTLPTHRRLIQPFITGHAGFDFVDRASIEHVGEGARDLRRFALACAARSRMARGAAAGIKDRVEVRHAGAEPALRRELIIDPTQSCVAMLREFLVDVEEGIGTRIRVGLWFSLEPVRAEEMNLIPSDGTAEGHARLLIRVRQHGVFSGDRIDLNEIRCVELVVTEVTTD